MPLQSGGSKEVVSRNIRELYDANESRDKPRPQKQIVAIALSNARKTSKPARYRKPPQE